ncbi:MAG TPA: lipopolysaccharide biosynthesis protein [Terriglobales bacterium]|jgi:O-antigen/teichoic acid export membrane protein|nr:lipopolysaccharide biosynthesis protein [Terriglobales bacterium]
MSAEELSVNALSTEHLHADLRGRSVRGGLVNLTSQGAQFLIQSIATVVLARLLTPADFGLVAMVATITGLGQAFADLGLSEATIQRKEITHNQVSTLFWINVAIGLALMLLTAALAPVLATFYREPRLVKITLLVSLTFLIGGLRVQPDAILKRQMRFSSIAIRDVAGYCLAVPLAIAMAWRGAGYWALVALPLTLNLSALILSWLMVDWRPGLPRRDAQVSSMIAFGGNVAASYFLLTISRSADNVLVGWYWGAGPLGLYSKAYNLLMLPVRQLSVPAAGVAIPAFSRIQSDPERFARYYLRVANLLMWISAPMFGFLLVAAKSVIVLILGNQWREATPVFQILVISALAQLFLESIIWLFVSRGQSQQLLKLLLIISPIIVCSFIIGLPFGIKGVALSGSLALVIIFPWMLKFAFHDTDLTLRRLGRAVQYPLVLCLVSAVVAELALHLIAPERLFSQLLTVALGFAVVYLFSALIPPVRKEMMSLKELLSEFRLSSTPRT